MGDRTSKFGRSKVDGHVQNSESAITNRNRSQSCDQSGRVVPSITHDSGQTSRATGYATMRLVVPFMGQFQHWWYDRLRSVTTGCTTLKLVVQPVVTRWWFHISEACFWAWVYCTETIVMEFIPPQRLMLKFSLLYPKLKAWKTHLTKYISALTTHWINTQKVHGNTGILFVINIYTHHTNNNYLCRVKLSRIQYYLV